MAKRSVMLQILILLIISNDLVSSSLIFLNGTLSGASFYSAPVTRFLGPQLNFSIDAELVYVTEKGCFAAATVDRKQVQGRAVYLFSEKGCKFERIYDQFASMGVVAVITMDVYIPGGLGYNMHDGTIQYVHTNMLYVQLGYNETLFNYLTTRPQDVHVRVSPDPSQWANMFQSLPYAICLRWIPTTIFTYAGIMALYYLYGHIRLELIKLRTSKRGRRPVVFHFIRLPIVALLIKMVESFILAFNFGMCGMLATPSWSAPAQRYFIQQMSGFTFVTILIAASFWNRILLNVQPTIPSLFKRILTGEFGQLTFLMYMLPIACETFFSICYAKYWDMIEGFHKADAGVHAMAQFLVGSQFLFSAIQFRMEAGVMLEWHEDQKMSEYLNRVSVIVIGLGITCLGYVIGTMMIAIYPAFVTPNGWTQTWSIITISHALESLTLVLLFRPRRSSYAAGTVIPIHPHTIGSSCRALGMKPSGNRSTETTGTDRR